MAFYVFPWLINQGDTTPRSEQPIGGIPNHPGGRYGTKSYQIMGDRNNSNNNKIYIYILYIVI